MLQYPWHPHKTLYTEENASSSYFRRRTFKTLTEAKIYQELGIQNCITNTLKYQINDVIHLAVRNSVRHVTDPETNSLVTNRIPSSANHDNTLRFLIAFLYEKQLGYSEILKYVPITEIPSSIYRYRVNFIARKMYLEVVKWNSRAGKIVEIMEDASNKVGSALAQNPDFIRNAALIAVGDKIGLELTTKANAISFNIGETSDQGNTISRTLAANTSFFMEKASDFRIAGTPANNTDTLTLTSKNGPNEITVTTNRIPVKSVLAKDASKVLITAEVQGSVVSTKPIEVPTTTRELPDITDLEVAEVQSVNIDGLFNGIRTNVTAVSADISKVTVSVNEGQTSMGVTGVAIGTTTITVTGTNEAGTASVSFDVTIIAASE